MKDEQQNLKRTAKEINQDKDEKKKKRLYKWLIISGIILIIACIVSAIVYWGVANKTEKGQIKDLDKAIQKQDADKLSTLLKSQGHNLPKDDANRLINYFNKHKSLYQKQMTKIKNNVDKKTQTDSTLGEIKDKNGKPVITISQDGVKAFFFKKVAFSPHYRNVYINSKTDDSTYQFNNRGKQTSTVTSQKLSKLGTFMVGDYSFSADKSIKDSVAGIDDSVSGHIHINTDKTNNKGKIIATEEFPQAWFKVRLENTKYVNKDYNLYVNDKMLNYDKNKTYGAYPTEAPLEVQATGKMNGATIKTNKVQVESNKNDSSQTITLKFDNKAIKKQIEKEKATKKDAQKFLKNYIEKLNHSYKIAAFSSLRKYFKDSDSDVANNIREQVVSRKKHHYSEPKFQSYKKEDKDIIITLQKEDEKHNTITSRYTLERNNDKESSEPKFKIKNYTDI